MSTCSCGREPAGLVRRRRRVPATSHSLTMKKSILKKFLSIFSWSKLLTSVLGDARPREVKEWQRIDTPPSSPFPPGVAMPNGSGTDPAVTAATAGYKLNHFMLRIRDPKKSLHFYIELMGMRTVFVLNAGPFTVYYLGYPQTDEHKADLGKFGVETCLNLPHTLGLLELLHVHGTELQPECDHQASIAGPQVGFGHLGFTVPDVAATVRRLKEGGVEVSKDLHHCHLRGTLLSEESHDNALAFELKGADLEGHEDFNKVFATVAIVKDPDGYPVELIPQTLDLSAD